MKLAIRPAIMALLFLGISATAFGATKPTKPPEAQNNNSSSGSIVSTAHGGIISAYLDKFFSFLVKKPHAETAKQ